MHALKLDRMPLFRFRISWEDDDNIYRDIILKSGQTFAVFQEAILKSFEFTKSAPASFFESNERWLAGREISSEVTSNKKGAPALSSVKTPVSALVNQPEKRFIFRYYSGKEWHFCITLIALTSDGDESQAYPLLVKSEGLAPHKTSGAEVPLSEGLADTNDQFDLRQEDMDEQGFSEDDGI
ncbi:MAG TPA: hypothetical protein VFL76_06885 [Edaphocola sp.]|nr:hypothetical protein [Edaphocola sp.]